MITTSWSRFGEILPVGEHAIACPSHRLTGVQARAGAPLRPAPIWTTTGQGDALSANGVPGWYDEDAQEHAAAQGARYPRLLTTTHAQGPHPTDAVGSGSAAEPAAATGDDEQGVASPGGSAP